MGPCVGQTGSAPRFGIPNLCLQDSPLGIRDTDFNTAFPAGITLGATFDKTLMYARGKALGEEARGKGLGETGKTDRATGRSPDFPSGLAPGGCRGPAGHRGFSRGRLRNA